MRKVNSSQVIEKMNRYGRESIPFMVLVDYKLQHPMLFKLDDIDPSELLFDINGNRNFELPELPPVPLEFKTVPPPFKQYREAFEQIMAQLNYGNSYLLNLTFPTRIESNYSLKDIFYRSSAKYKVLYKNQFVVFSPEIFVQIRNAEIFSYPMKGTINAGISDSENLILANKKEIAEHSTIVDLIRNDLNMVSKNVEVTKFRYIDRIKAHDKEILQVSSEIKGVLPADYKEHLGDILFKLLPAGSICGAPKKKTLELIEQTETYERGYYTGIVGLFDGENLDTGVMIRFIEQGAKGLVYKSGGGITVNSKLEDEYQELIDKVYVPVV
ncbi:aminodeoxychorismate synthase component I [Bacteroidota bacterium]